MEIVNLLYGDFGAADCSAAEEAHSAFGKFYYAVFGCVNGVVSRAECAVAGAFGAASLTNYNLTCFDSLAAKKLHAKALPGAVMIVLTCSTCFYV